MNTLREHLEAVERILATTHPAGTHEDEKLLDEAHAHAVAALAILDAAERLTAMTAANWGPPNEFGQSVIRAGTHLDLGIRLVPDPERSA